MIINLDCGHPLDTVNDISEPNRDRWRAVIDEMYLDEVGDTSSTFDCPVCGVEHILTRIYEDPGVAGKDMMAYLNKSMSDYLGEPFEGDWYVAEF